jgi:hypothetical protein
MTLPRLANAHWGRSRPRTVRWIGPGSPASRGKAGTVGHRSTTCLELLARKPDRAGSIVGTMISRSRWRSDRRRQLPGDPSYRGNRRFTGSNRCWRRERGRHSQGEVASSSSRARPGLRRSVTLRRLNTRLGIRGRLGQDALEREMPVRKRPKDVQGAQTKRWAKAKAGKN